MHERYSLWLWDDGALQTITMLSINGFCGLCGLSEWPHTCYMITCISENRYILAAV